MWRVHCELHAELSAFQHMRFPPALVDVYESLGFKQSYSLVSVTLQNRFVKIFLNPSAIMYLCTVADPTESRWIINIQSILENMSLLWPSLIPSSVIYFVHVDFCKCLVPLWLVILLSLCDEQFLTAVQLNLSVVCIMVSVSVSCLRNHLLYWGCICCLFIEI